MFTHDLVQPTLQTVMFIWPPVCFLSKFLFVSPPFSGQFGRRFAWKIEGYVLGCGINFGQKMAPNCLRESRKLQINMSGRCRNYDKRELF